MRGVEWNMFGREEIEKSNNFNVGDRVVIQNNLERIDSYLENYKQSVFVTPLMKSHEGHIAIITNKIETSRKISPDKLKEKSSF